MANSLFLAKTVLMSWIVICFMINVSSDDNIPDHFTSKLIKLTRTFRSWFLKCQEKVREIFLHEVDYLTWTYISINGLLDDVAKSILV